MEEVEEEEEEEGEGVVEEEEGDMEDMEVAYLSSGSSFSLAVPSSWPVSVGTLIGNTLFAQPTLIQVLSCQRSNIGG